MSKQKNELAEAFSIPHKRFREAQKEVGKIFAQGTTTVDAALKLHEAIANDTQKQILICAWFVNNLACGLLTPEREEK